MKRPLGDLGWSAGSVSAISIRVLTITTLAVVAILEGEAGHHAGARRATHLVQLPWSGYGGVERP